MVAAVKPAAVRERVRSNSRGVVSAAMVRALPRRVRSLAEFAEQEVILPTGPYAGTRFRREYQPFAFTFLTECQANPYYREVAALGPVQSGKSMSAFIIPAMYHICERVESCVIGIPRMEPDAMDKWRDDLEPMFRRSRYANLLPDRQAGSRGGAFSTIRFKNGAAIKFMSGEGSDASRSGYAKAKVLLVTEADKVNIQKKNSAETSPIEQMRARVRSYGFDYFIYQECTVTNEAGYIFQAKTNGTDSELFIRCQYCERFVLPEREHLRGWQGCESEAEVEDKTHFVCPNCDAAWNEGDRRAANFDARIVHAGQAINDAGEVEGEAKKSRTFGFRWTAAHNLFVPMAMLGLDEWRAARNPDRDAAEKKMVQFIWAKPFEDDDEDFADLDPHKIATRVVRVDRGVVPPGYTRMTAAADIGGRFIHWTARAWNAAGSSHVVDYGILDVPSSEMALERAVQLKLSELKDILDAGFLVAGDNHRISPELTLIDARWQGSTEDPPFVFHFCIAAGPAYMPAQGFGVGQFRAARYRRPVQKSERVKWIGDNCHAERRKEPRIGRFTLMKFDANHHKSMLHNRITMPVDADGAMTLFEAPTGEHIAFARHLCAERMFRRFVPGRGFVIEWKAISGQNHFLDANSMNEVAASFLGIGVSDAGEPASAKPAREGWLSQQGGA